MNNFFSGIAVVSSLLALIASGFSIVQVLSWQNKLDSAIAELKTTVNATNANTNSNPNINSPQPTSDLTTSSTPSNTNLAIQPGQFTRSAFSNLATIELLKVNRIPQQSGKVNVQMRIRLTSEGKVAPGLYTKSFFFWWYYCSQSCYW